MVEIPGGSFIMGSSDEDIIDAQNDITRTMTVRTFYMDETEIPIVSICSLSNG